MSHIIIIIIIIRSRVSIIRGGGAHGQKGEHKPKYDIGNNVEYNCHFSIQIMTNITDFLLNDDRGLKARKV